MSEVTLRESFTYSYRYSDEDVIDTSLEIINLLLDEHEYPFDFLVENLWWSGFTMKSPELTRRLVEGIHSSRKGIMLDTGHYMNTSSELATAEDAADYLHAMLDEHEAAGVPITDWIKGLHLQMSLGGEYVKRQKREWREKPLDFSDVLFYDLFSIAYTHACSIDLHRPFLGEGVKELIARMAPAYVTFEFSDRGREAYEEEAKAQSRLLGYL